MTVLHYTGYTHEQGGIVSVIRALRNTGAFRVFHGVSEGFSARGAVELERWIGPRIAGEKITPLNIWRARCVALTVRGWLRESPDRVFHGHSRAGLLVGLWLLRLGERRLVVSVHCYGRQRWFYRWAARRFGDRLFWLTPAMRSYYGLPGAGWDQCLPGGVMENPGSPVRMEPGRLRLGGAGLLVEWKRWDLVLTALARLPADCRGRISFEHIGGPDETDESQACVRTLQKLTARHDMADNVRWCGPEPSSRRLLAEIDVLVVPSHNEPYSMILQEALAAGVPVLASASGGPLDVVKPGVNGWFFRDGDAEALAEVLQGWLRVPPAIDRDAIRRSARLATDVAARWREVYGRL
jgi:glycosyltransferase involved in cell wall biosynthesis